ncbi:type 4a pilus biogenesis protein PilO [Bacteriovorax sp. PP10]|uniref:Type 4a pilus biogenesis protein PilO n=1 Tax=Bacteriovorax antarcticus TaxID=3088717 RepID=A0ABU5VQK8_9BACT|nr:type 4a pilus biogenesis protein PilO [Bacteriovorax sp. PP10]MEA9354659.1 type 4a pilus biogenesis protein PilO [Bacteriovorax sp. PP10]
MEKILKNLHWFIIAYAAFELYTLYSEANERLVNIESQQEVRRAELSKNKKIQREITNYYKNIEEEKVKIERVAREIEKMQQLLPSEISDSDNISLLRRMADDVNIKELSIAPEMESDRGFYIARRYRIKAKATFLQFLIMFEKIAENKRILNVGESSFKKSELPQRSKFQVIEGDVVIEAYRYNANFKEDRGIDEIEQQFKDEKHQGAPTKKPRAVKENAE